MKFSVYVAFSKLLAALKFNDPAEMIQIQQNFEKWPRIVNTASSFCPSMLTTDFSTQDLFAFRGRSNSCVGFIPYAIMVLTS